MYVLIIPPNAYSLFHFDFQVKYSFVEPGYLLFECRHFDTSIYHDASFTHSALTRTEMWCRGVVWCVSERDTSMSSLHALCDQVQPDAQRQLDCSYTGRPAGDRGGEWSLEHDSGPLALTDHTCISRPLVLTDHTYMHAHAHTHTHTHACTQLWNWECGTWNIPCSS